MVRKLALAVSLALGTLSVPAHALGLGELSSKSTLNQNFRGDIALLSVQPDELDSIRVKLADSEAFERAGVERPFYLSLLKFEPTVNAAGKTVVRVTSEFPIREPFLNFLVEINWPNGRLLREYTVLLDPPVTTMRRPPTVTPAARTAAPVATPAPATPPRRTEPVEAQPKPTPVAPAVTTAAPGEYGPVKANDTAWRIASRLRPDGASMEQMMMALLAANPEAFIDGNINRLKRGKILRVPALAEIQEISRQQARQAYREQQDQWLARRDAKLRAQVEGRTADAQPIAGEEASDDQLRIATARPDGEGEAGAGEDDAVSPTASDLKSRLMVARENAETSRQEAETLRSQVDDLEVRLRDMQKLLSLKDEQLAQLQDRMTADAMVAEETPVELVEAASDEVPPAGEAEAADVQLANQQVDAETPVIEGEADPVEQTMAEVGAAAATEASEAAESDATEPVVEPTAPSGLDPDFLIADVPPQIDPNAIVTQTMVTESAGEELVIGDDMAPGEIVIGEDTDGAIAPDVAVAELAVEPAPVTEPSEPTTAIEPQTAAAIDTTTADRAASPLVPAALAGMIEKNIVPIAGGAVLLLGLIGWLVTRGRGKADKGDDLPLAAAGASAAEMPATDLEMPAVDQPVPNDTLSDLPDSAFLDEFSPSDINALQDETGEVDPVSEADVYIAYGRYQQAEDLLGQAMEREPDRLALKHKLLEVHYATRNAGAFTSLAQAMVDAGQDTVDEEAWVRAQDMGRELVPDHPLFESKDGAGAGLAAAATVAGAAAAATVDDDTLSLDGLDLSDLSELSDEYEPDKDPVEHLDSTSEVSIALNLDDSLDSVEPITADVTQTQEAPESISLDELESLDFELPESETSKPTADDSSFDLSSDTLDLDTMMAEAEAAVDGEDSTASLESEFSADELQAQLDELSDLAVLDSGLGEPNESQQTSELVAPLGLDLEDVAEVSDDLNTPLALDTAFETAELDSQDETLDLDLGEAMSDSEIGEDDVATKLDLARAYVEMGDEEGARSILEEVLAEGNAEQKGDAEKLIADLA